MISPIREWFVEWLESVNPALNYRDSASHQIQFIRDKLAYLAWRSLWPTGAAQRAVFRDRFEQEACHVIAEHRSKSVRLPVYRIKREDLGLSLVLRGNFYDWNVSVESRHLEIANLYDAESPAPSVSFEGFPAHWRFGAHSEDKQRFSVCLWNKYELFAFVSCIVRELEEGLTKP